MPIIGKIKIGELVNGFPRSLDYFRIDSEYAEAVHKKYGEKPTCLPIGFISDEGESSIMEQWVYRENGKIVAKGDGEEFMVWNPSLGKIGQYELKTKSQESDLLKSIAKKYPKSNGWQVELTMRFILPGINTIMGMWQLTTKGVASSIEQIVSVVEMTENMNGSIVGVPFDLTVTMHKSQKPGDKSKYPVLALVPHAREDNPFSALNGGTTGIEIGTQLKLNS